LVIYLNCGNLYFDRSDSVQPRRGKGSSWPGLRH